MALTDAEAGAIKEVIGMHVGPHYIVTGPEYQGDDVLFMLRHERDLGKPQPRMAFVTLEGHLIASAATTGGEGRDLRPLMDAITCASRAARNELDGGDLEFFEHMQRWAQDATAHAHDARWGDMLVLLLDGLVNLEHHLEKRGLLRPEMKLPEQVKDHYLERGTVERARGRAVLQVVR